MGSYLIIRRNCRRAKCAVKNQRKSSRKSNDF